MHRSDVIRVGHNANNQVESEVPTYLGPQGYRKFGNFLTYKNITWLKLDEMKS